jgi:FemAB-related protein (PEP-CTERM system-associated)
MNITLAQEADAARWDAYADTKVQASPYHLYAWRQSIEKAYGQRAYYLLAEDDKGDIHGILPIIHIKPPLLPPKLCSLPYCDRGEALADSPALVDQLISKALEIREQTGAVKYEYRASLDKDEPTDEQAGAPEQSKVRMLLQLPESSEALLAGFKAKLRSQIRKAEKNGLAFELGNDSSLVSDFYNVFTSNMRDLGSPTHSRKWFDCISRYYGERCLISIVRYGDTPIGAGLVLLNANTATIPWASTLRRYNRLAPNMLLYWSLLEYVSDNGYQYFDFGRSTVGEGTYKFKKQWGAKPVRLDWQILDDNQIATDKITATADNKGKLRQRAESTWRKLPLWMTITIGSRVRKYISL